MSLLIDITKKIQGKSIEKSSIELQNERINICEYCPHLSWGVVRSCGKFLQGGKVTYKGEEKELCGCDVDEKAKYKTDGCPLEKW
jgi:hypothetical protein|tara:strand:- start:11297 stop:11551 length:255 start_codon:yes stop_codon:yes gene_type:complete